MTGVQQELPFKKRPRRARAPKVKSIRDQIPNWWRFQPLVYRKFVNRNKRMEPRYYWEVWNTVTGKRVKKESSGYRDERDAQRRAWRYATWKNEDLLKKLQNKHAAEQGVLTLGKKDVDVSKLVKQADEVAVVDGKFVNSPWTWLMSKVGM